MQFVVWRRVGVWGGLAPWMRQLDDPTTFRWWSLCPRHPWAKGPEVSVVCFPLPATLPPGTPYHLGGQSGLALRAPISLPQPDPRVPLQLVSTVLHWYRQYARKLLPISSICNTASAPGPLVFGGVDRCFTPSERAPLRCRGLGGRRRDDPPPPKPRGRHTSARLPPLIREGGP